MKQIWSSSAVQLAGKYGEHAPMAGVCCNACRTCVTTNMVAIACTALAGLGLSALTLARRLVGRP